MDKEKLLHLYCTQKMSMAEVARELGTTEKTVVYWMDKYNIPRRSWSEATYAKRNPDGDPFEIKELKTKEDFELFTLGVGLYVGEGNKRGYSAALSNADPQVIKVFLRFLREICRVDESKICAELNLFDDLDVEATIRYWQEVTQIPISRFRKPIVRKSRGGMYQNKSAYGTLTIRVCNTKLRDVILGWCQEVLNRYS